MWGGAGYEYVGVRNECVRDMGVGGWEVYRGVGGGGVCMCVARATHELGPSGQVGGRWLGAVAGAPCTSHLAASSTLPAWALMLELQIFRILVFI